MPNYNSAPGPNQPTQPTPYEQGLDTWRDQIVADYNLNGSPTADQIQRAQFAFQSGLDERRVAIRRAELEHNLTYDEAREREQVLWQRMTMGGLQNDQTTQTYAKELLEGYHREPKNPYDAAKKELDPTRPWYLGRSGRVEIRRATPAMIFMIGRLGTAAVIERYGPTKFASAKKLYNRNPTYLLTLDPSAQYLRPSERPKKGFIQYFDRRNLRRRDNLKEFRYAEQDPNRPLIRMVGDMTTQDGPTQSRMEHRKAYIEARQRLLKRELRGGRGESYWLADMHEMADDYKKQLSRLEGVYKKTHGADLRRFFRASEQTARLAAINALNSTTQATAANLAQTLKDHRDLIDANFEAMTNSLADGPNPVLDQADRNLVLNIRDVIEDAFEDTGFDATWDSRGFDAAEVRRLLPSRSTPYETERAELVRAALNKTIAEKAEQLASYGKNKEAEQMLKQFKKIGILHEYAYDAIKVMTDNAYISYWQRIQTDRLQPDGLYSYYTNVTNYVRYTGKIPPQGDRDRRALSSRESDLALQIIVDGIVERQLIYVHGQHRGANRTDDLLRITSTMHDDRAAAAHRSFFTPPRPKKPSIPQRISARLNRNKNNSSTTSQP